MRLFVDTNIFMEFVEQRRNLDDVSLIFDEILDGHIPAYISTGCIYTGNIRAFVLNFGDEATGISDMVNNKKASTSEWYSLDGRKLNSVGAGSVPTRFHKGIYINNGRKVVIK